MNLFKIFKFLITPLIFTVCFSEVSARDSLQLRGAAFIPSSSHVRCCYDDCLPDLQLEWNRTCQCRTEFFLNFDFLYKKQEDSSYEYYSRFTMYSQSFGFKFIFPVCSYDFYLGLGPVVGEVLLKNEFCEYNSNRTKVVFGGVLKSGVRKMLGGCLFGECFADFCYLPVTFDRQTDLGGFRFGLGLGIFLN